MMDSTVSNENFLTLNSGVSTVETAIPEEEYEAHTFAFCANSSVSGPMSSQIARR